MKKFIKNVKSYIRYKTAQVLGMFALKHKPVIILSSINLLKL